MITPESMVTTGLVWSLLLSWQPCRSRGEDVEAGIKTVQSANILSRNRIMKQCLIDGGMNLNLSYSFESPSRSLNNGYHNGAEQKGRPPTADIFLTAYEARGDKF